MSGGYPKDFFSYLISVLFWQQYFVNLKWCPKIFSHIPENLTNRSPVCYKPILRNLKLLHNMLTDIYDPL